MIRHTTDYTSRVVVFKLDYAPYQAFLREDVVICISLTRVSDPSALVARSTVLDCGIVEADLMSNIVIPVVFKSFLRQKLRALARWHDVKVAEKNSLHIGLPII